MLQLLSVSHLRDAHQDSLDARLVSAQRPLIPAVVVNAHSTSHTSVLMVNVCLMLSSAIMRLMVVHSIRRLSAQMVSV
jgi:hypothetical protein